jgi:hypothetical protein
MAQFCFTTRFMPFIRPSCRNSLSICLLTRSSLKMLVSSFRPSFASSQKYQNLVTFLPEIAKILGATKKISAPNSKVFAKQIGKYIDSKDQKRGKKDKEKKNNVDPNAPALWPLIRQVRVRCPSAALSTGAVLVDLPGVADANAARNNIAKSYMKKVELIVLSVEVGIEGYDFIQCDCIWILAPITRAVDDKTARGKFFFQH